MNTKIPNNAISSWKTYLNTHGFPISDIDSDNITEEFKRGMMILDGNLAKEIPSMKGILWQENGISPTITVEEYDNAINTLRRNNRRNALKSFAVANFDAADVPGPKSISDVPLEVRFVQSPDTTLSQFESADPDKTQQQGVTVHKYPMKENIEVFDKKTNVDGRMMELVNLIENLKNNF